MPEGGERCPWERTLPDDQLLQSDRGDLISGIIANRSCKVRELSSRIFLLRSSHEIDFTGFTQQILRSGLISLRPFRVLLSGLTLLLSLEPLKTGDDC
jgi:hypothetical protein